MVCTTARRPTKTHPVVRDDKAASSLLAYKRDGEAQVAGGGGGSNPARSLASRVSGPPHPVLVTPSPSPLASVCVSVCVSVSAGFTCQPFSRGRGSRSDNRYNRHCIPHPPPRVSNPSFPSPLLPQPSPSPQPKPTPHIPQVLKVPYLQYQQQPCTALPAPSAVPRRTGAPRRAARAVL